MCGMLIIIQWNIELGSMLPDWADIQFYQAFRVDLKVAR